MKLRANSRLSSPDEGLNHAWMSQEVSLCSVNGLQPAYKWGILEVKPTYKPFTNFLGHPSGWFFCAPDLK